MSTTSGKIDSAVKKTIDICKSEGVLQKYLTERESEVTEIMLNMFETKKNFDAYVLEQKVLNVIESYKELGKSPQETVDKIIDKFGLSDEQATQYVNGVWENRLKSEDFEEYFASLRKRRNPQ